MKFLLIYVPNLRFEKFNDNWSRTTINKVCVCNPKNEDKLDDEFIYIDLESVEKGVLKTKNIIHLKNAPSRAQRILYKNDILFQSVRPYQRNNYLFNQGDDLFQYVASTGYIQIRTTLNPYYLFQLLNTDKINNEVMLRCTGTSYPAINSNDFSNIVLTITNDRDEQNKIAEFFSLIEERINTQIKIINSIKSQIRTINNHIAFDSTSSELSIASLFHVKTSNKLVESNTGKFCIVDMGTIDANGNYIIGKYTDDETSLIPYGTLVMPKDDIGGGKIICKTMCINASNKYALSDHVFALKLKNDNYNPVYFSALINSQYNNHKLKKLVTGSAQLGINQENLNRYKLKFSDSLELQHKYSELIIRLNEKLIVEKRLLDLFSSQKKYLLKNMFV